MTDHKLLVTTLLKELKQDLHSNENLYITTILKP